jgi:hypothetical protein
MFPTGGAIRIGAGAIATSQRAAAVGGGPALGPVGHRLTRALGRAGLADPTIATRPALPTPVRPARPARAVGSTAHPLQIALVGRRLAAGAAATCPTLLTVSGTAARLVVRVAVVAVLSPAVVPVVVLGVVALLAVPLLAAPLHPIKGALCRALLLPYSGQHASQGQGRQQGHEPSAGAGLRERAGQSIEAGSLDCGLHASVMAGRSARAPRRPFGTAQAGSAGSVIAAQAIRTPRAPE